ncbi:MAG: hypothetical protein WC717_03520 [Candidatus Micrarchaeia archaeon]|jgi:hypothetical protein
MKVTLSTNGMRGELAKTVDAMRTIRNSCLVDGKVSDKDYRSYRLNAAQAAGFSDCVENSKIMRPWTEKIAKVSSDPSIYEYDPLQDRYWMDTESGKEFLQAIRMAAVHNLQSAASGVQDAFHVFQLLKIRLEGDSTVRSQKEFVLPAYGGIAIPHDYMVRYIPHLTGIANFKAEEGQDRLTLRTGTWYPDEGKPGVDQVKKVLEAARFVGFRYLEFWMPTEIGYSELKAAYGDHLVGRQAEENGKAKYLGRINTENGTELLCQSKLASVDFGESRFSDLKVPMLEENGVKFARELSSIGFSNRLVAVTEGSGFEVSFGMFLPPTAPCGTFLENGKLSEMDSLIRFVVGAGPDAEKVNARLMEGADRLSANYAYAAIKYSSGEETIISAASDTPKWGEC